MVTRTVLLPGGLCVCVAVTVYLLLQMCASVPGQPASKLGHQTGNATVYTNLWFRQKKNFSKCLEVRENRHRRDAKPLIPNVDGRRADSVPAAVACFLSFRLFHRLASVKLVLRFFIQVTCAKTLSDRFLGGPAG